MGCYIFHRLRWEHPHLEPSFVETRQPLNASSSFAHVAVTVRKTSGSSVESTIFIDGIAHAQATHWGDLGNTHCEAGVSGAGIQEGWYWPHDVSLPSIESTVALVSDSPESSLLWRQALSDALQPFVLEAVTRSVTDVR